jgi:hypothetical protein
MELTDCIIGRTGSYNGRDHVLEVGNCRNFVPSAANTTLDISKQYFSFKDTETCNTFSLRLKAGIDSAKYAAIQSVIQRQFDMQERLQTSTIIRLSIPINDEYLEYPTTKRILRDKKRILESGLSLACDAVGDPVVLLVPIPSLNGIVFPSNCVELHLDNHNLKTLDDAAFPACLTVLSMNGNRISTFGQSQFPAGLTRLSLNCNDFKKLDGLKFPEGLRELYLDECHIQHTGHYEFVFPQGLSVLSLKKNKIFQNHSALAISKLLPASCTELYLDECEIGTIAGVAFPESLAVLSLKRNMISTVEGALFPESCTYLDLSFNRISSFEGAVFPTGCKAIINDQQVTIASRQQEPVTTCNNPFAHESSAGEGAVTLNIQEQEQESECCFQLNYWLPSTTRFRASLCQ